MTIQKNRPRLTTEQKAQIRAVRFIREGFRPSGRPIGAVIMIGDGKTGYSILHTRDLPLYPTKWDRDEALFRAFQKAEKSGADRAHEEHLLLAYNKATREGWGEKFHCFAVLRAFSLLYEDVVIRQTKLMAKKMEGK